MSGKGSSPTYHGKVNPRSDWKRSAVLRRTAFVAMLGLLLVLVPSAAVAPAQAASAPVVKLVRSSLPTWWDVRTSFGVTVSGAIPPKSTLALQAKAPGSSLWKTVSSVPAVSSKAMSFIPSRSGVWQVRANLITAGKGIISTARSLTVQPAPVAPPAGTVAVGAWSVGVNEGFAESKPSKDFGSVRLWDAGVLWRNIETAAGVYDWSVLDAEVETARDRGQKVVYVFGGTPTFYAVDKDKPGAYGPGSGQPPKDPADFRRFVDQVMARYGTTTDHGHGMIEAYEAWTEMNYAGFWQGPAQTVADMTQAVHDAAVARAAVTHEARALVLAASTTSPRCTHCLIPAFGQYLDALAKYHWPVDAVSVHVYPTLAQDASGVVGLAGQMRRMLTERGASPTLPMWNTEVNLKASFVAGYTVAQPFTDAQVRSEFAKTVVWGLSAGMSRTHWYMWSPVNTAAAITLHERTIATATANTLKSWLGGAVTMKSCVTSTSRVVTCQLTTASKLRRWIAWSKSGTAKITMPTKIKTRKPLAGPNTTVASTIVSVGTEPVLLVP